MVAGHKLSAESSQLEQQYLRERETFCEWESFGYQFLQAAKIGLLNQSNKPSFRSWFTTSYFTVLILILTSNQDDEMWSIGFSSSLDELVSCINGCLINDTRLRRWKATHEMEVEKTYNSLEVS